MKQAVSMGILVNMDSTSKRPLFHYAGLTGDIDNQQRTSSLLKCGKMTLGKHI